MAWFKTASKLSMIVLCGLGIGAYWAWNFTFIASSANPLMWLTNVCCHLVTLALSIPFARRLAPFSRHMGFVVTVPGLIALGTLAFHSVWLLPDMPYVVQWVSSSIIGVSSAGLFLLWSESFARFTIVREQEIASYCGIVSGFALYIPVAFMPRTLQIVVTACLPILSAACIAAVNSSPASAVKGARARGTFAPFKTILPLRLVICSFIFSIPLGYFKGGYAGDWGMVNTLALFMLLGAILLEAFYKRRRKSSLLPKTLILLISGGLLILPFFSGSLAISGMLVVVGSFIFRAYLYQICGIIVLYAKGPKTPPFALASVLLDAGWIAGIMLRLFIHDTSATWFMGTTVGIAYLIFAIGLVALSKRFDFFELDGTPAVQDADVPLEPSLAEQGERIAVAHSLTRREKEIAILLASGYTIPEIASRILLSKNTVKTHVSHVYQKCEVHSREELLALFE